MYMSQGQTVFRLYRPAQPYRIKKAPNKLYIAIFRGVGTFLFPALCAFIVLTEMTFLFFAK